MNCKILGLILCSMGSGMLIVIILPSWGFFAAAVMVICGILLLRKW